MLTLKVTFTYNILIIKMNIFDFLDQVTPLLIGH